jgi:hypothetical protein
MENRVAVAEARLGYAECRRENRSWLYGAALTGLCLALLLVIALRWRDYTFAREHSINRDADLARGATAR